MPAYSRSPSNFPEQTPVWVTHVLKTIPSASPVRAGREPDRAFNGIVTDSRKIVPGCLFVALPGDQFDGHDFISTAIEKGARGVLCRADRQPENPPAETWVFPVPDTVQAYRRLGGAWRNRFDIPVIMVAGSAGKTTTKEFLASILRGRWESVLKTIGSQNGFVGIPMTLLEIRPEHGAAVIEVGIDEIGAMSQHVALVRPSFAVLTAIGPEHLEKLKDIETVAAEEAIALTGSAFMGARVAINLDDPWIEPLRKRILAPIPLTYSLLGSEQKHDDRPSIQGRLNADAASIDVLFESDTSPEQFQCPLPGKHNAMNLLCALTVAHGIGLSPGEMRSGLAHFKGAEGRSQLRHLADGSLVLCDYYNSQPASLHAGLELLAEIARRENRKTTLACLGDMLELGTDEEKFHRDIADPLVTHEIAHVLLYGPRMKWLQDELKKRGFSGSVEHFDSHAALAEKLMPRVDGQSVLLIKGSRGMKMEEAWKILENSRR